MNLKMKTLAAAMIAAGTLGTAQASQILFPYVVNSATVTTVVSIINSSTSRELHWELRAKPGATAENNTANCTEFDQYLPTSQFDLQTVDLAAHFGSTTKGVLFNDPSINNNWVGSNKDFAIVKTALGGKNTTALRGFLIVDTQTRDEVQLIEGEAMVYEFASGATWGYTAGRAVDGNFANDTDITATTGQNISIKPWAETSTKFFVTPIDANMFNGNDATGQNTKLSMNLPSASRGIAMFDRDENPYSGTIEQTVVCVGAVNAEALVSLGVKTSTPNGGWGKLVIANSGVTGLTQASVIKLDYNSKPTFNDEAVTGTFNNAFQLR